jgi:transcriptional regulator with XRE-family HTH domain
MDTGTKIQAAREAKGLTQTDLAAAIGVTRQAICNYEQGRDMRVTQLVRIAKALGVKAQALLP